MQNGHTEPEALLQKMRHEVQQRKLALERTSPVVKDAQPEVIRPSSSSPKLVITTELPPMVPAAQPERNRFTKARSALDRALVKNDGGRGWPRFLRGLRRNQGAVNESIIGAVK